MQLPPPAEPPLNPAPVPNPGVSATETAPETWQAAIVAWIWKSRHREKIVLGGACLLPLIVLWTILTTNIGAESMLGRLIGSIRHREASSLSLRHENNPAQFKVLERMDFIDLDTFREVPASIKQYNVSPTIRETHLRIQKLSADLVGFYNHSKTTGNGHDVVCLSGHPFTVQQIAPNLEPGEQVHNEYELAINLASVPRGAELDLKWQTVAWNKYQESNSWWTSVVAEYAIEKLVLVVDFPKEAGITLDNIVLMRRKKPDTAFTKLPHPGLNELSEDPATGEVTWTIYGAELGVEYAVAWNKSLATLRGK